MLNRYQWAAVAAALFIPSIVMAANSKTAKPGTALQNLAAFLLMVQYSEGTHGANAYRLLYGGGLFHSYDRHPNQRVSRWGITSTAAGAYQFLFNTWQSLAKDLTLIDFTPASQNKAAIELVRRKAALTDVLQGKIADAIYKCRKIWASLPGAGYGQNEKSIEDLLRFYVRAGGKLNTMS
ncbi:MAG: glycoside hydrolase family 104 protein [Chitinophagaceae bacterium]